MISPSSQIERDNQTSVLVTLSVVLMTYGPVLLTAGMGIGDEAHSIDAFEELCELCRKQGLVQDTPAGLFQTAQQQLGDLAELMHSYGFPTPGWGEEEREGGQSSPADMSADQVYMPQA